MAEYGPSTYGERIADMYDDWHDSPVDTEEAVAFLAGAAGEGPSLELGIGTGRVALPLAARGLVVHGIEASPAMVDRLREKPAGSEIPITIGDFADVDAPGPFSLVFVVYNTFLQLASQDEQCRCVANVANRLSPGGRFVVQAIVPDLSHRFDRGQRVAAGPITPDRIILSVNRHDPVAQHVTSAQVLITAQGAEIFPLNTRYVYPPELDLMARLAGLELEGRYAGWQREPFTAASPQHISIYRRPN